MPELATELAPADDDARLEQAEAQVRSYCGWHIAPSRTEMVTLYPGFPVADLLLPSLYVTDVVSVTEAGVEVDPTMYLWKQNGIICRLYGWPWGTQGVTVEFTHGYADVPADVTAAVQAVAALGSQGLLRSRTAGPFSETYASELGGFDASRLDHYRIPARP